MDAKAIIEEFFDFVAPKLDVYEQAMYLYILRHEEFIRGLYRDGYLNAEDFDRLVANLQLLRRGSLRPNITNIGNTGAL